MFTRQTNNTESYDYGIIRSEIADGRIIVVRTQGDMSRNAINTWASLLILTMQDWKSEQPLALLHDFRHPRQGLTPYTRERTLDVLQQRPSDLTVYSAVLLPNTFMKRIIDMFLRTPAFHKKGHTVRIFHCENQAIDWLHTQLASH